jgi:threonine dehydrogenase-like Zn-dependent dehydrogenase
MKAAVLRAPRDLAVLDIPVPTPGPGEVLLQVGACGICGSDLRYFEGENPWAKHTLGYEKPNPPNMVLGHEVAGLHQGQRVAVLAFRGCGQCVDCRRGKVQLCAHTAHLGHGAGWKGLEYNPGGMAEWCPVWKEHLFALPEGVSVVEGTFLDGLGVAVHAVRRAELFPGAAFAVLGAGPIGLSILQAAKALGAGTAWVTDVYDAALACATELGADEPRKVSDAQLDELAQEILSATGGRGLDAVFESTGNLAAQEFGLRILARGGCLMLMAGAARGLTLTEASLAGERRLTTSSNNLYEEYLIGLELLASGRVKVGPMITHRFPLVEAPRAFQVARKKWETGALKVILEP